MKTCFVIMPIGDQEVGGKMVTAADLKRRYDDLIKEAILLADPNLEVVRADEVAIPGTITSDILFRLMHSDIVIADVTFPNSNVFYELGIRHSCRVGTVIIKDRSANSSPFDISHLRHISYDNTPTGLKDLSKQFRHYFDHFARNPAQPDNQLLELAKLTEYAFLDYKRTVEHDPESDFVLAILQSPDLLALLSRKVGGEEVPKEELMTAMFTNPDTALKIMKALSRSGQLDLGFNTPPQKQVPHRNPSRTKRK
jgi:hypothetical protein